MDSGLNLSIIAAVSENGVIGNKDKLPWNLKTDLKRFADLTKGHVVIVGRKTHDSILNRLGHPLTDRVSIVVSRKKLENPESVVVCPWKKALSLARNSPDEVFVIGGAEIYKLALPYTNTIYLTRIHANLEGDAFFPEISTDEWEELSRELHQADEKNSHDFTFVTLRRRVAPKQFVNLEYARYEDQRTVMERIHEQGICPFCPEHRTSGEVLEPLYCGKYWILVPNRWPYEFTTLHAMLIAERHLSFFDELKPEETAELGELLGWARRNYGFTAYSLGVRCGDPHLTGGTVDHLHVHLVVADPETSKSGYKRVRFPMGPRPTRFKTG